jgi:hypothetical protein
MAEGSEIEQIRAACLEALRAGASREEGDKETNRRLHHDPSRGFVEDTFDALSIACEPESTRVFATEKEVLAALAPAEETAAAWQDVLARLRRHPRRARPGEHVAATDPALGTLEFEGELPGIVGWSARAEGLEERYIGAHPWPHVRVRVEVHKGDTFAWRIAGPDQAAWREQGPAWLRAAIERRLGDRLAVARMLDFSRPDPLPGLGEWTARHEDRYEDDGIGFDITVSTPTGSVSLHRQLARPGTTDAAREHAAARTRLRKWIRRALSR